VPRADRRLAACRWSEGERAQTLALRPSSESMEMPTPPEVLSHRYFQHPARHPGDRFSGVRHQRERRLELPKFCFAPEKCLIS